MILRLHQLFDRCIFFWLLVRGLRKIRKELEDVTLSFCSRKSSVFCTTQVSSFMKRERLVEFFFVDGCKLLGPFVRVCRRKRSCHNYKYITKQI